MRQAAIARRGFTPLLTLQAAAAFANSMFKAMLAILFVFVIFPHDRSTAAAMTTAVAAANAAPHFLFAALAGQLGDRMDKVLLARIIRGLDCALMVAAGGAVAAQSAPALVFIVFVAGARATFFSPLKYAILPHIVSAPRLMLATGAIQGAMAIAAIGGQMSAGALNPQHAVFIVIALSALAFAATFLIPRMPTPSATAPLGWNPFAGLAALLRHSFATPGIRYAILGISLAEAIGALLLAQVAPLVRHGLGGGPAMVSVVLAIAAGGTLLGSLMSGLVATIDRATRLLPWAVLAAGLAIGDLTSVLGSEPIGDYTNVIIARLGIDVALIGIVSGFTVTPLHTLLQSAGDDHFRVSYASANNVVNAVAVMAIAGGASGLIAAGVDARHLLGAAAALLVLASAGIIAARRSSRQS